MTTAYERNSQHSETTLAQIRKHLIKLNLATKSL